MAEGTDGHLFKDEYEREMEQWLRRRFGWLLGSLIVYEVLSLVVLAATLLLTRLGVPVEVEAVPRAGTGIAIHVDAADPGAVDASPAADATGAATGSAASTWMAMPVPARGTASTSTGTPSRVSSSVAASTTSDSTS